MSKWPFLGRYEHCAVRRPRTQNLHSMRPSLSTVMIRDLAFRFFSVFEVLLIRSASLNRRPVSGALARADLVDTARRRAAARGIGTLFVIIAMFAPAIFQSRPGAAWSLAARPHRDGLEILRQVGMIRLRVFHASHRLQFFEQKMTLVNCGRGSTAVPVKLGTAFVPAGVKGAVEFVPPGVSVC